MSPADGVVVTGLGVLSAAGAGRDALATQLVRGEPVTRPVDVGADRDHPSGCARCAALVGPFDVTPWIPPLEGRRMSAPSRFAVIAGHLALADAGLPRPQTPRERMSVVLATAFGPSAWTQLLLDQLRGDGPSAASPILFSESVLNAPAGRVAIACRAAGPNHTLSQGEVGPLLALARGAGDLSHGRADLALAGTVEEITPLLHRLLDCFRALARPGSDGRERARPFDRRRDGFLAAEGATIAVLEREEGAAARGATPLVRLRGWHAAFDPTASRVGWGRGAEPLAHQLRSGLERAGLRPGDIDVVVSGAAGGCASDRLEAAVLHAAWRGAELPPIIAPKAVTGEYGGAFLAAALLIAAGKVTTPLPPIAEPDPELGIELHAGPPPLAARRVLVTSLAAGGAAAWLVLERP